MVLNIIRQIENKRKAPTWKRTIRRLGGKEKKREGKRREEIKNRTAIFAFSFFIKKRWFHIKRKTDEKGRKVYSAKKSNTRDRKASQETLRNV